MKTTLIAASVVAIAAFASTSSFAESKPYPINLIEQPSNAGTNTRAGVQAELVKAQKAGYTVNSGREYQRYSAAPVVAKTRAEVQAELKAAGPRTMNYGA